MPKYKLIKEKDSSLYRIQALDYINTINGYKISPGDYGGLVSSAENLDQKGNCWITYNAKVIDNAFVSDNAVITGNAVVSENAQVFDNVIVYDDAYIYGHATLSGNARIYNYAQIFDYAIIADNAEIHHYVQVFKNGCVVGNAILNGDIQFTGMVANTIDKSNEIKINQLNTEIMATQSKSEEKKEPITKNFVGTAFEKTKKKLENGLSSALKVPEYGIVLDANKIAEMQANRAGNILLSVYRKKDAKILEKENKPTCYVVENNFATSNITDKFSIKDIIVNKEELLKFSLSENNTERIYLNIDQTGKLVPTSKKYEKMEVPKVITGIGYNDSHLKGQNVGSAYQYPGSDNGAWYSTIINVDKAQHLPADAEGKLNFSLVLNKNKVNDKSPDCYIVFNPESQIGRRVDGAIKEMSIDKDMLLNDKVALKTVFSIPEDKIDEKIGKDKGNNVNNFDPESKEPVTLNYSEKTVRMAYINISQYNNLQFNKTKYPELVEQNVMVEGYANNVKLKEKTKQEEKITKQEVKEVKTEKAAPKKRAGKKIS